jgi:predicted secreted acid phosphatase
VKIRLAFFAFCLLAGACRAQVPAERGPQNLSDAKNAVSRYCDSGDYRRDFEKVIFEARAWIEERAARRSPGERLAVVMDIDETLLDNTSHIRSLDYAYLPVEWDKWVMAAKAPAYAASKALFLRVRELGIELVLITGRTEPKYRACTQENLRGQGLGAWSRLLMFPATYRGKAAVLKSELRASLEKEGLRIIANIGDQESDLSGGYSERSYKVPDPFYRSN